MICQFIPSQLELAPKLPTIEGNVDYRNWRQQLETIDRILIDSGIEKRFVEKHLEALLQKSNRSEFSLRTQLRLQIHAQRALRCTIARTLLNENFRDFSVRLADSPLLQSFCHVDGLDRVVVPGKSTVERYSKWASEEQVREVVALLNQQAHQQPESVGLEEPVDLDTLLLDTTCLEANIHYPVDWVLFRDATRTLMKQVILIRGQGLKHRMPEPERFIRDMNRLCIEMTHTRAKVGTRRHRKIVLRKMDKLLGTVKNHAQRYYNLLDEEWDKTEWTRAQTEQVLDRLEQVLVQLPAARQQARQRILREEPVNNEDKILSFYEPEVQVIVRKKAGAEVEFGNTLLLGESVDGLILDWELLSESAPADSKLLIRSLDRTEEALDCKIKEAVGDRGFSSQNNEDELESRRTYNAICPRSAKEMKKRQRSKKFNALQGRRGQTEARIAIFKNNILKSPLLSKGFEHRELAVAWGVLAHNLWVLARFAISESENKEEAAKAAA